MSTPKTDKVELPYICPDCKLRTTEEHCRECGGKTKEIPTYDLSHVPGGDAQAPAYIFRNQHISSSMMKHIRAYIVDGAKPGPFLQAIICNDLGGALRSADPNNYRNLHAFYAYFHWEATSLCWGDWEKMEAWIEHGGEKGRKEMRDKEKVNDA